MSLDLDTRQRAMLQEMGIHVWLPKPAAAVPATPAKPATSQAQAAPAAAAPAPKNAIEKIAGQASQTASVALKALNPLPSPPLPRTVTPARPTARPMALPAAVNTVVNTVGPGNTALADGIATMDWPSLSHAVQNCQACPLCIGRRAPVFEPAHAANWRADWLVVGEPPDDNEEREGTPFVDQAGQLLDNMLKAVGVARHSPTATPTQPHQPAHSAYVTSVVKCRSNPTRTPSAQELATCAHFLQREIALVQPKVIVAMGRFAAQTLLCGSQPEGSKAPFGKLRGTVYRFQGIPVIVTYHPSNLLRTPLDKARAWADLCLALAAKDAG